MMEKIIQAIKAYIEAWIEISKLPNIFMVRPQFKP